jgi:ANTAR domain
MAPPAVARQTEIRSSAPLDTLDELVALRRENAVLRESLEARKVIELAKALLMWRDGLSEPAAHRYIQKSSMDSREPMVEVARSLIPATPPRSGQVRTASVRPSFRPATTYRPEWWTSARRWATPSVERLGGSAG